MRTRLVALLASLAIATTAQAHEHGPADAHAAEELTELYRGVTGSLVKDEPGPARPLVRYQLRGGVGATNQDPFSTALSTALRRHDHEDHDGHDDHDEDAPRPGLRARLNAMPGKLGHAVLKLSADAWQGTKEYGAVYAVYTGATELLEHGAGLLFPPLMFLELNFVLQPAFFLFAKPIMTGASIAKHTGSGVPLLARLRSVGRVTRALMFRGGGKATDANGVALAKRDVAKANAEAEAPIAHVAKSAFFAEAHLAMKHAGDGPVAEGETFGRYVGKIFDGGAKADRMGRVVRLDSGFGLLRDSLGELIGSSYDRKELTTKQFFRHKAALGKLGRLSRDMTSTLATYANADASSHAPEAVSLVKQLAGLYHDAHVLTQGDKAHELSALEAKIKGTSAALKRFRARGPRR